KGRTRKKKRTLSSPRASIASRASSPPQLGGRVRRTSRAARDSENRTPQTFETPPRKGRGSRFRRLLIRLLRRAAAPVARGVEAVLLEQVVQRGPADVDVARGARDVARVARERVDQQPQLRLVARRLQRRQRLGAAAGRLQLQVLGPQ